MTIFEQIYTAADGRIGRRRTPANDGLAGSVISILEKNRRAGQVPVTGQDATVEGLQNVLAGTQCMTVYKSATGRGRRARPTLAIALAKGEEPKTTSTSRDDTGEARCAVGAADAEVDHEGHRGCGLRRRRSVPRRGVHRTVRGNVHRRGEPERR